jgi:hypothetical protein
MIESCIMTTNRIDDAAMVELLLNNIKAKIDKMAGDGAYDKTKVYEGFIPVITGITFYTSRKLQKND